MIKKLLTLLLVCSSSVVYAWADKYTISVCMTLSLENALICKKSIFDNMDGKVFIVKDKDGRYYTYLNVYENKNEAKLTINKASTYVKKQKPYVKAIDENIISLYSKKETFIDLTAVPKENRVQKVYIVKNEIKDNQEKIDNKVEEKKEEKLEEVKETKKNDKKEEYKLVSLSPKIEDLKLVSSYPFYEGQKLGDDDSYQNINNTKEEELKKIDDLIQVSMEEFDKADDKKQEEIKVENKIVQIEDKKQEEPKIQNKIVEVVINKSEEEANILNYEELIIQVDANTNLMTVNAKINNELKEIKQYVVSTAKKDVKRPFGEGKISKISLNPIWYPTQDTLKTFRKRGINLPSVVPPGHKYNYMGAAKINLTHIVDGKNTFRIHGTLSEKTIGTNESAGCIRMRNSDVLQLASLLNDFSQLKSLNEVKVILK
ncbi:L,D-transpeptidase [bacterium]|nr:L,D-transpeptidase [bacterium]